MGLTLVATWVVTAPESSGEIGPVTSAPTLETFVPAPIDQTGEARDRAIYSEIRRAQNLAMTAARSTARQSGGGFSPVSPSSRKQESRRVALAAELAGTSLQEIALAYGMSVGDLKALYLRGDAAGWGRP
jgi:hypothetical protein